MYSRFLKSSTGFVISNLKFCCVLIFMENGSFLIVGLNLSEYGNLGLKFFKIWYWMGNNCFKLSWLPIFLENGEFVFFVL